MKRYQVTVYNESDNSYRIALDSPDYALVEDKVARLEEQGHTVKINIKGKETPSHLKDVPSEKLDSLIELFKPRL